MKVSRGAMTLVVLSLLLAVVGLLSAIGGVRAGLLPGWAGDGRPFALMLGLLGAVWMLNVAWWLLRVRTRREPIGGAISAQAPEEMAQAAEIRARRAREFIERVQDPARRGELSRELAGIEADRTGPVRNLRVVIFGTVSAGKTSLINALLGREVGETDAVMGTTRRGASHTYELKGVDGTVYLTDTPGLSEVGEGGLEREAEARALATRSDLLLFVIDHDLIRSEYEPLIELARLGKRSIIVLNKKDRFPDRDLAAIVAKLGERLEGVVEREDIVTTAAAPRPLTVRNQRPDGSYETVLEYEPPDVAALRARIGEVLAKEGKLLHAANLLVRGRLLEAEARDQLTLERERLTAEIVERYQWITAATVFANPIPALDVVAGGAVQLDMIRDLALAHGIELSSGQIRALAAQMVQSVLKLGLLETATSLVAGVFKRTLVGFAAGGAVQAVTMAYLARVAGKAFLDYFAAGQSWGREGIDGTLLRQFERNSRVEFVQEFAGQVVQQVLLKIRPEAAQSVETRPR
jgi:small GTP-binding protein